ncbi:MAG: hypothetical protein LBU88_10110 [Treponema sp.]|jgi:hypothetical protein|nr:hypothetical protein [Treponema sp.]
MKKLLLLLGACILLASCSAGDPVAAAFMVGRSSQSLVFLDSKAAAEDEFLFSFSQSVKLTSVRFEPSVSIDSIEEGSTVKVKLAERLPPGIKLTVDLVAEDEQRNTINVLVQLRSRNNRMPKMVINEIRTENDNPKGRGEFIEFVMETAGNLGGMRVFIFGNTAAARQTLYEFSSVEVAKGEYVMLNLRTLEAEAKDEYGSDLAESGGANSSPNSRDFWIPGSVKRIHKTSVVYVLDQDDNVLAAIMMSENPDAWWGRSEFADAAQFLFSKGAWKSAEGTVCTPAQAVITAGTTPTRTICRDETVANTKTAADWYIVYTGRHTPGEPNDPRRYNP